MRIALALWLLSCFLFSLPISGQVLEKIADLEKELKVAATPLQKARLHNQLAYSLLEIDVAKASSNVEKASEIIRKHSLPTQEAENQWVLGQIHRQQLRYNASEKAFARSMRIFRANHDALGVQKNNIELGVLYSGWGMTVKADSIFAEVAPIVEKQFKETFFYPYFYFCIGVHTLRIGEQVRAIAYFRKALEVFEGTGNTFWVARVHNAMGLAYKNMSFRRLALEHYLQALRLYDKLQLEHRGLVVTLKNVGNLYVHWRDSTHYKGAIRYYLRAKHLAIKHHEIEEYIDVMNNLGRMYMDTQPNKGLAYLDTCLQIAQQHKRSYGVANIKQQKADIYIRMKRFPQARKELMEAIEIYQNKHFLKDLITCYTLLGHSYRQEKVYDQAIAYYLKTEQLAREGNFYKDLSLAYSYLGYLYFEKQDCEQIIYYTLKREEVNEKYHLDAFKADTWVMRAKGDSCRGDYAGALKWYMRYTQHKDSVDRQNRYHDTQELQHLYSVETQEKESQLLKKQNAWQKRDLANQMIMLVLACILLFFVGFLSFISLSFYKYQKQKNQQIEARNQELEDANAFKTKLISIIAHDLRRPYTNLIGTLQLIREGVLNAEEQQTLFDEIEKQTTHTNEFINNLLLWAKAQQNAFKFQPMLFDMRLLSNHVLELLKHQAEEKGVRLYAETAEEVYAYADIEMLKIVMFNLVTNAIKFTADKGEVCVSQDRDRQFVYIHIKDTGVGISPENQQKLLDKKFFYTSGTAGESGFGLGLMICYDFVVMNHGNLSFESEVGKGTSFTIALPTQANNL